MDEYLSTRKSVRSRAPVAVGGRHGNYDDESRRHSKTTNHDWAAGSITHVCTSHEMRSPRTQPLFRNHLAPRIWDRNRPKQGSPLSHQRHLFRPRRWQRYLPPSPRFQLKVCLQANMNPINTKFRQFYIVVVQNLAKKTDKSTFFSGKEESPVKSMAIKYGCKISLPSPLNGARSADFPREAMVKELFHVFISRALRTPMLLLTCSGLRSFWSFFFIDSR